MTNVNQTFSTIPKLEKINQTLSKHSERGGKHVNPIFTKSYSP
jgi:hypothetical protein